MTRAMTVRFPFMGCGLVTPAARMACEDRATGSVHCVASTVRWAAEY